MASASSSNGTTATTGPKISSRQAGEAGSTGARTVGGYQNPGPSGTLPRIATGASSGTYAATRERWPALINGPISLSSDAGSSTRTAVTAFSNSDRNSSSTGRSTRM